MPVIDLRVLNSKGAGRLLIAIGIAAALLLLPALGILLFPDRLLEEARPWLERVASDRLQARVRIGRLSVPSLVGGRLRVTDLRVEREGEFDFELPRGEVEFSLFGLLTSRLETVFLEEPALTLTWGGGDGEPLPESPPIRTRHLQVAGGRLRVETEDEFFRLREIRMSGALDAESPFSVEALVGGGEGIPVSASGSATWGKAPTLTLQEAAWAGTPLLASPLTIRLPDGGAAGTLHLDRFDDAQLRAILAALHLDDPLPAPWSFALEGPEIRFSFREDRIHARIRIAAATLAQDGFSLPLQDVEAEISGWQVWQGEGTFRLAGAPGRLLGEFREGELAGSLALTVDDPAAFKRLVLGGDFPSVSGGIELESRFQEDRFGTLRLTATALGRPGSEATDPLLELSGLRAEMTAEYPAGGEFTARGRLLLGDRDILLFRGTPKKLEAELRPTSGRRLRELLPLSLHSFLPAGSEGLAGNLDLARGAGGWRGEVRARAARLPFDGFPLGQVEVLAPVAFGETAIVVGPAHLDALWKRREKAARLQARVTGRVEDKAFDLAIERFELSDFEVFSADGLNGLTGGRLAGKGKLAGRRGEEALRLDFAADLTAREILYGSFYADLAASPARMTVSGLFEPKAGRLQAERLELEVSGLGRGRLRGTLTAENATLGGKIVLPDLAAAWAGPVGQGVAPLLPDHAGLAPAGSLEVELALRRQKDDWRLAGELRPSGLDLHWPGMRLSVAGMTGSVPFDLRSAAGPGKGSGKLRRGELQVRELRLGPAALADSAVHLAAAPNWFGLGSPLALRLAGGRIEMAEAAAGIAPGHTEASARVRLQEVDLGRLTREMGWTEMAGQLSADLGRIRYADGMIAADGEMSIEAFGGNIRVGGLRLESPFSEYPSVQADIRVTGLDLHRLTRTFEFGEINGVVDGYVRGLRLFGKVPSAFEAVLETRESGERNISVKALSNLSILSQGGFPAILSQGIYRFIDFYRYRKIGIACSLRNDVFTLNGTARPDSDRYLVYGGLLPPKIDIVASSPTISFKEMLRRLQRIERAEAPKETAGIDPGREGG